MSKINGYILAISIVLLILLNGSVSAYAAPPYPTYTYDNALEAAPSPAGYLPHDVLIGADFGIEAFNAPQDICIAPDGEIYIADTGNNRIIVLNSQLKLQKIIKGFINLGKQDNFKLPEGVYVNDEEIYVADTQNGRIIILDKKGNLIKIIGKPVSDIIPSDFAYKPQKVVADKAGRIYVVASGVVEGILQFTPDGQFNRFFGSNRVKANPVELLWRRILTREQVAQRELFVPIEYSNLYIDHDGFLYTSTRNATEDQIKRLNAAGDNIIRHSERLGNRYGDILPTNEPFQFLDISVDTDGNIFALENSSGRIYIYSALGDMLFVIGGRGEQKGLFANPVALEQKNGKIFVVDGSKNSLTILKITDFGNDVLKANSYYMQGRYEDALQPWQKVLKRNANYDLAYVGLGNAYLKEEKYAQAMDVFKLARYRKGYSEALKEYRTQVLRENFSFIMTLLCFIIAGLYVLNKVLHRHGVYLSKSIREYMGKDGTMNTVLYALYVIIHPFDGFWDLKHYKKKAGTASVIILTLAVIIFMLRMALTSFLFNSTVPEEMNILTQITVILLPLTAWVVINWSISTLMDGEATMKHIWISSCYALTPLILLYSFQIILSNFITIEEGTFYYFIDAVAIIWTLALTIIGNMTVQDYTMGKTVTVSCFSVFGILAVIFLGMVFFSALQQLIKFITTLYLEIKYMVL
ncbi:YIP1 family protein [Mahella australiensis]|uniref:NHL repeat containing protein n=1 Tax=Mahella australiensis (strain DSM 15567 / CIP 107919 / 50-1 BON) TaxID=697281 RepID=F4A0T3_MAHA5|nr:YIP1 family protein [Mahella australiensis]AEE96979.1 NHL repeat containing protein [Mahella australiensis 50-1 BON]